MNRTAKKDFLIDLAFVLSMIGLIFFSIKYLLICLLPFFMGFAIAFALKPVTEWMCRYMKMRRRPAAIIAALVFYLVLGILLWLLGVYMVGQVGLFLQQLPSLYQLDILPAFDRINEQVVSLFSRLSTDMGASVDTVLQSLNQSLMDLASGLSGQVVTSLTGAAKKIPIYALALVFTMVSSIFICADYRLVVDFIFRQIPKSLRPRVIHLKKFMTDTVGRMLWAYLLIMAITFVELLIGLSLLQVEYAPMIAALVAVLDILPLIGSGGVLVPWAVLALLRGDTPLGVGILLIYAIITVVRNIIEPRIVGKQIGLHPLVTISAMFFGIRVLGVGGVILGPIGALLLKYLNDTGTLKLYH